MILSDGKNNFENNVFKFWEWSAPVLQTPEEVIHVLHELKLKGRMIQDIRAVGIGYNWQEDSVEEASYCHLEKKDGEARELCNQGTCPKIVPLNIWAEIDEPILLKFADGDVLAMSFDEGSSSRLSMNTIPWDIQYEINPPNFHANRLFADILGKVITSIEITATLDEPDFTGSHGLSLDEQPAYLRRIAIYYDDGGFMRPFRNLSLEPFFDYGHISLIDHDGSVCKVFSDSTAYITEGYI